VSEFDTPTKARRFRLTTRRMPRLTQTPVPELRLRLRTKLVVAMVFAALVPVVIVALLATRVILSSLENELREDADRQLTVGLSLVLRAVERLGDESVQLAESSDLIEALQRDPGAERARAIERWLAGEASHVPSARVQVFAIDGTLAFEKTLGGADARFEYAGVKADDPVSCGRGAGPAACRSRRSMTGSSCASSRRWSIRRWRSAACS
jgi:hypothetical protein